MITSNPSGVTGSTRTRSSPSLYSAPGYSFSVLMISSNIRAFAPSFHVLRAALAGRGRVRTEADMSPFSLPPTLREGRFPGEFVEENTERGEGVKIRDIS